MMQLEEIIGQRPKDLNSVLFLIGAQELGLGPKQFDKEEKQDLIHIGICKVLSLVGYYELIGTDEDGWPHWQATKKLPSLSVGEQEKLLRIQVMEYFDKEIGIVIP